MIGRRLALTHLGSTCMLLALGLAAACGDDDNAPGAIDLDGSVPSRQDGASSVNDANSTTDAPINPTDGGDGGDAAASLPLQAGLKLWLDPEKNVTTSGATTVTAWGDRSGTNTPTTINNAPTFAATGLGGHAAVRVATSQIDATLASGLALRPFSIFAVGKAEVVAQTGQVIYVAGSPGIAFLAKETDDTARVRRLGANEFNLSSTVTGISSKARVFGVRRKDATMEIRIDGTVTSGVDPGGTFNVATALGFGGIFAQGFFLGDVLVYDAELTDPEATSVEAFLKAKYGL